MALTYRSPIEEVLTLFEPTAQSLIASTASTSYHASEKENFAWFNYSVPAHAKEQLSKAGIYLSPYAGYPHSHPVCKLLENYLLYKVVPNIINNTFYFVGIKQFKLNFLKKRFESLDMVQAINRYVSSADKIRYGNEFVVRASSEDRLLKRHVGFSHSDTLKHLIPNIKTGANLFLHDELHYWNKDDLITFLEVCKPEVMLGTLVYPPEILVGAKSSLNPWCYEFERRGDKLLFFPDGVRSEGYEQPVASGFLLKTNRILLGDGTVYCVDLICSKFAHHLMAITRGNMVVPEYRSFGPFEAVQCGLLQDLAAGSPMFFPVSSAVILRVYRYLRSLKKPDRQSAMAKFTQLSGEASGTAIKFMEELSDLIIETRSVNGVLNPELLKRFFGNLGRKMPLFIAKRIRMTRELCLDEFIASLRTLTVDLKLEQFSRQTKFSLQLIHDDVEEDPDLIEKVEAHWIGGIILERTRTPYVGMIDLLYDKRRWVLEFDRPSFLRALLRMYLAQVCGVHHGPTMSVADFVVALGQGGNLLGAVLLQNLNESELREIACAARYLQVQSVSWFEQPSQWFSSSNLRRPTYYIDAKAESIWSYQAEVVTHAKPRMHIVPLACCEENYYLDEFQHVHESDEVQMEVSETGEEPEQPAAVTQESCGTVECACGLSMPISPVPYADLRVDTFADALNGRRGTWYAKRDVMYRYTGGVHKCAGWPRWLELWMIANGIDSIYDCMLAQQYNEGSKLGFHADDEAIFKKGSPVLTVNLGGSAQFGVCCSHNQRWNDLQGDVMFTMPEGFQETHKHAVRNTSEGRISYTFRVLKPVVEKWDTISSTSSEGSSVEGAFDSKIMGVTIKIEPKEFNPKSFNVFGNSGQGNCFWNSVEHHVGVRHELLKKAVAGIKWDYTRYPKLAEQLKGDAWAEDEAICATCLHLNVNIAVFDVKQKALVKYVTPESQKTLLMKLECGHFEAIEPREICTIKAIAEQLKREPKDVLSVALRCLDSCLSSRILDGQGLTLVEFESLLELFGIQGFVLDGDCTYELNPDGKLPGYFQAIEGHLTLLKGDSFSKHSLTNIEKKQLGVCDAEVASLKSVSSKVTYRVDLQRASLLAKCLHEGLTGVISSELFNERTNLYPNDAISWDVCLNVILGTFGCGKSRLFKEVLRDVQRKSVLYISPRKHLCLDFEKTIKAVQVKVGNAGVRLFKSMTFEKAMLHADRVVPSTLIILDEIQLYPPGYVDLLLLRLDRSCKIFLLGDPCQSDYDSEKDRAILGAVRSDINHILDGQTYNYNVLSHRFTGRVFSGRLPCKMVNAVKGEDRLLLLEGLEAVDVKAEYAQICLVSSFEEKKIVGAFFGGSCKCYTFGESTGMTFKIGSILVTGISSQTCEKRWVTALSRFRDNVALVNATGSSWEVLAKVYRERTLGKFLSRQATLDDLQRILPGFPTFTDGFVVERFGADEGKREAKLSGDPWLKTMVDLLQVEDQASIEQAEVLLADEWFKTHLPQCELEGVRARWVHKILAKEFREKRMGCIVSEQFTDEHSKQKGKQLTNAAERFETIYPRHRAADTVTFVMAVRKRLRFSDPVRESAKLFAAMQYGPFLLREFLKKVPLKPMHNSVMMEQAKFEFEEKKTSKSAAIIENHSSRSMREWAVDFGLVFSKSQLCTKFDNRFRDAKAAQTIVCFQHAVLCRFAPYMRYIEKKLNEVLPEKYYIHSGKGLEELNEWVIKGNFGAVCTESDYEAFDASQDQYIMAFEICLMRYLRLPNDLIEDYKFIKTHLGSKLGNFAIMRFSGEASTFLFNTMANMLFTFLQYDLTGRERICFAGDDMCSNTRLHVSGRFKGFMSKLKLKAKVFNTQHPTFCGWNLCPDGIYKKPQLVLERLCIAKETNNLANCIDNYAIEVGFAYKLGERATLRMNEEELDAFYNCVRIIVKNKHLLKSDILELYSRAVV
nr:MAG: replicase [Cactus carlavirus 1]